MFMFRSKKHLIQRGKTAGKGYFMFQVGDCIAHPMHGAGVIDGIEERRINGVTRQYYMFKLPVGGMTVMIPVDHCDEVGVRPIIDEQQADEVLEQLSKIEVDVTQNWNRRYRENMLRIKSGDLLEVARVIKCLMQRDSEKGLSTGDRKMLRSAKQILISELVLSKNSSYEEVEEEVNAALA